MTEVRQDIYLAELTALTEAGLAILRSQLDVDALCELVYEHAARIVDAHSFHLGLFQRDGFALRVWVKDGVRQPPTSFPGAQETGILGWMRTSQRPLLVRDFAMEMDSLPARPSYESQSPPRSALFVPLVAGDQVVGSMSVQHPQPNAYSEDDLRLLGILANQAASALSNAHLFRTVQQRAEQLATIAEVSRAITAVLDLGNLLNAVVELIRERFGYYHVQVYLVEDQSYRAVFRASSGHQLNRLWREQERSLRFDQGIIGWVAGSGQPLLADDVLAEPRYIADDPRLLPDTRSELAVPLKIEDRVLGVLDVQSQKQGGLDSEDLYLLSTLANQVAVAVDAARAYQAQQEEAWITTVLLQVAESASRADTLEDVLGTVTRLVPMLTGVTSCGIWMWQEELQVFELAAAHHLAMPMAEARERLRLRPGADAPALALVQETVEALEVEAADNRLLPEAMGQAMPGDRLILLPLVAQNRLMGAMVVSLSTSAALVRTREKRLAMLRGIANQTAAALENVRLTTAHQEEAWISWALLEVSQAIGNARSVEEMLDHVVRLTPLLAGIDRCAALLWQPEIEAFVVVAEFLGFASPGDSFKGRHLQPGDLPLLDRVRASGRLQRVDDTGHSELVPPQWAQAVGSKTLVALPLMAQQEVLGILLVDDVDNAHRVSQRREDILSGIARQAALALENFRLQAQERERARMSQELQVARHIQSSFLPEHTPRVPGYELAHRWQAAREVGGDFYDFISLSKGRLGLLMADVSDKGVPAALFAATSLTLLQVTARSLDAPQRMLDRANQLITANNSANMFVTAWYGVLDPVRHSLHYANAGHSLVVHVGAKDGEIRRLQAPGIPLGIFQQSLIEPASCQMAAGDLVVLYTDGVIDCMDSAGAEFGQDRLESVLFRQRHRTADQVAEAVIGALQAHAGTAAVTDDITLVVLKRVTGGRKGKDSPR